MLFALRIFSLSKSVSLESRSDLLKVIMLEMKIILKVDVNSFNFDN